MAVKGLHKTLCKRGDALSGLTAKIAPGFDIDTVHDFRTNMKKYRALLRAFAASKRPLTRSFKKLVRITGDMRNTQFLIGNKGIEDERLVEFRKWLHASLAEQENLWKEHYGARVIKHQLRKAAQKGYKKSKPKRIEQFWRKKVSRVKGILSHQSPSDNELHDIRKTVKDMQYVMGWANKHSPGKEYAQKLPSLQRIAKQAGDFNDKRIALDLLDTYLREKGPSAHDAGVETIKQKWETVVARKRKSLMNALNRYITSVS